MNKKNAVFNNVALTHIKLDISNNYVYFWTQKSLNEMKFVKTIVLAALCALAVSCGGPNLEKGLVLYSDFEKDASDLGPYHFDGVLQSNAVISDDCAVGESSVYLNGVKAYVEYPAGKVYFNRNYSVSIWVKWEECRQLSRVFDFDQIMPQAGNSVSLMMGANTQAAQNNLWFDQWVINADGEAVDSMLDFYHEPGDGYLGYNFQKGQWEHYVLIYNSSASNRNGTVVNSQGHKVPYKGEVTLYVNGKKVGSTHSCMMPQNLPTVSNWLGRSVYSMEPRFQGWLDDFRIYNRCLSEEEIEALYKLGSE